MNFKPQSISVSKVPPPAQTHYQTQSQVHSPVSLSTFPINKETNRIIKNATSIQSLKSSINNNNNNKFNINLKDNIDGNKFTHDDSPHPPTSASSVVTTPDLDKTIILNFPHKSNNNDTKTNIKSSLGPTNKTTTNINDQTNNPNANEITTANNNATNNSNVSSGALSAGKYSPFINNNDNTLTVNKLNKNKINNNSANTAVMGPISGSKITSNATISESPTYTQYPSSVHLDGSSSIGTNSVANSTTNFLHNQNQHNNNNNNNMDNGSNFNSAHASTRKSSDSYSFRSLSDTIVQPHNKFGSTSSQDNTNFLSNSAMTAVSNSHNSTNTANNNIDSHNNHTNTNTNSNNSTSTINNAIS
ncbi:unnamed protein product [[Candida] boidinii]|nr:unnamed protein product [[Candida] boidinii]